MELEDRPFRMRLEAYGCTDFIRLDGPPSGPEQLEYLDLLPKPGSRVQPVPVTAVAEHQGTALLYLLDSCGDTKLDAAKLGQVQRQLANRSDPAWLGVVGPGTLEIYPIGFHRTAEPKAIAVIQEKDGTAPLFFQSLVHGTFAQNRELRSSDYVFKEIFSLLTQTTDRFVPREGKRKLEPLDVLSMAGRALFFRFLIDRQIVRESELQEICPSAKELKDTFSNAEKAAKTSSWLDETFNGDFLQLIDESIPRENRAEREVEYLTFYQRVENRVGEGIFRHLEAILRGWHAVNGGSQPELELGDQMRDEFQPELDWNELDFAHVPVGVLSQVYESFSHRAEPEHARETSVHYTPRSVAGLMVDQSFAAVKDRSSAFVLDPSCGAGIFLVLAFRRLVSERWKEDGKRPKTRAIQDILYKQLRGFDVSEPALRLAALALYITAIEVNGTQRPPKDLRFPKNLRERVLFRVSDPVSVANEKSVSFSLGSLGPNVPADCDNAFDIVIGNPPWTRLRETGLGTDEENEDAEEAPKSVTGNINAKFTEIGRRVLKERGFKALAASYENPDKNPDLPFLWRAAEWAKFGGVIALAMPARLFGRTAGKGYKAWCAVLRSVEVTGLINGADLRKTAVWEDIDMPFCILFLRNSPPRADHRFYYATPIYDPRLNCHARFRLDYQAAQPISVSRIEKQPWVLKTLSLGTWLDVEVMEALTKAFPTTLAEFWKEWNPTRSKTGKGYSLAGSKQTPVPFLARLKDFRPPERGFSIDFESLNTFKANHKTESVYQAKGEELYQQPLVIIPKAPGDKPDRPRAFISKQALAFSQTYYGYSCKGHPEPETLASLIYLLAHSTLFRYFALMTSVSQGADHMIFTKEDFDALPFPNLVSIKSSDKASIRKFAVRLEHDSIKPFNEIDRLVFRLYGLEDDMVQVVEDTLFAAASYRKAGKAALLPTTRDTRTAFIAELQEELDPYFDVCGEHSEVREANFQPDHWKEPWFFLEVSRAGIDVPVHASILRMAMELANERGTSRIIVRVARHRGLVLGLLNQCRWWTKTRARLCSQHIIKEHLGSFGLTENV